MYKKVALNLTGFALTIFTLAILYTEDVNPFNQYIDTKFAPDFEIAVFEQIKAGESKEEVEKKLGIPIWKTGCGGCWDRDSYIVNHVLTIPEDRVCNEECSTKNQIWEYADDGACTWWDFAWKSFNITFHNGIVVEKESSWHGD